MLSPSQKEVVIVLRTKHKRDGTYEITTPWPAVEQDHHQLETLLAAVPGAVIRVCRHRDTKGQLRPVKAVLSVDPSAIIGDQGSAS